jgi:hypothetical protein
VNISARTLTRNGKTWTGDPEALAAFESIFKRDAERKAAIPWEAVEAALTRVALCLRDNNTDSTAQLKRFLWSLWNGDHHVNLYRLGTVLDSNNSEAVALIFSAYMLGILREEHLRWMLEKSGEMHRWETARAEAEGSKPVDYPPVPNSLREHVLALGQIQ